MDLQFLKNYFSQDYQGIESIIKQVYQPIFGAENFEDGFDVLTRGDTAFARKAKEHKIVSIFYYGKFYTEDLELNIYDVTLDSSAHIATSRVGIRQIVAEMVEAFDGALVVFHYAGNASNRSWRLSYIEKIKGMQRKAKRFTYLCGQNYSCRTIAERFIELQHSAKNAKALEAAFSVEALSDEFFTDYKKQYETFCKYIEDNKNDASRFGYEFSQEEGKYIRDYVKKMLGRLTFLCFLQRRGWLGVPVKEKDWYGGDTQFLFNLYRKATDEQRENFLDEILEPLFFDCLNEKREGDIFDTKVQAIGKVKIPYLNGGLFDKDEIDKPRSVFPAKLFGDLFEFFASYNFTIDENDPNDAEVGVDPEMLGKIFENLLEDNKDNGTFYTPKEIVHYMCRESLIAYLIDEAKSKSTTTENFEDAIRTFVSDPEISVKRITQYYEESQLRDLSDSLRNVKICDPAIGSGAFPMGLFNLIYRCRLFLNQALGIKQTAAQLKQEIIQNNIYGVDIEKGAIDIARLRFWLSIIVDAEVPEPLPNFDYKFMQGNSLLEQFEGVDLKELLPKEDENDGLRLVFSEEQAQYEILKNRQEQYFRENDHKRKYELREHINTAVKDLIRTRTSGRQDINEALENINVSANTQFFLWHTWFADVFNRPGKQGFDIVIGNPPYIDSETMTRVMPEQRELYSKQYKCAKGNWDIYITFMELALTIGRIASLITPDKWLSKPFGYEFRKQLMMKRLTKITHAGASVFSSATVDAIITLFKESSSEIQGLKFVSAEDIKLLSTAHMESIQDPYYIDFLFSDKSSFIAQLDRFPLRIKDLDVCCEGACATSDAYKLVPLLNNSEQEIIDSKTFYKLANTGTIIKFAPLWGHKQITYLGNKVLRPIVSKEEFNQVFGKTYILRAQRPKIIFKGLNLLDAFIDAKAEFVPGKSTLVICSEDIEKLKFICAVINSKLAYRYIKIKYQSSSYCGGITFTSDMINLIPLPQLNSQQQRQIVDMVDLILTKKQGDPEADTSTEEKEIDRLVYELYGIDEAERKSIEE